MNSLFSPLLSSLATSLPTPDEERPAKKAKTHTDEAMYAHIVLGCCCGPSGKEEKDGAGEVRLAVLKRMLESASAEGSLESNRRKAYALWREEGGDDDE
jgi:hypothetical protein